MIRILLVDDHPVVRHGIRTILMERMQDATVGEASDANDALEQVKDSGWDLVVADISLPGASGLDLIKQLRSLYPTLPTLVMSVHPAAQFARRALRAGAAGYLTKDSSPDEFVSAVEQVWQGQRYIGADSPDVAAKWTSKPAATPHEALSDREYQVLRLLGSGRTVSEIARELTLSVKTVSTYRSRALEKLGMHTNAEMMRYAIENQLVES
jgi:DNA-binding NarL/FixJ family response regulator